MHTPNQLTLRSGLSLVSMMNSYLHSSQQRVSELLIHCCRQDWWTKRKLPVQWHGVIRALSSSPSQWQILQEAENTVNTKLQARQLATGARWERGERSKREKLAGEGDTHFSKSEKTWELCNIRLHISKAGVASPRAQYATNFSTPTTALSKQVRIWFHKQRKQN